MSIVGIIAADVVLMLLIIMIYEIYLIRQARNKTRSASVLGISFTENLTYGELSAANIFGIPSMNDEEINALHVHNDKGTGLESEDAPAKQASSSSASASASAKESLTIAVSDDDGSCDELLCNICLEQVMEEELVCCFPCIHQFHDRCIVKWIVLSASCPVCDLC